MVEAVVWLEPSTEVGVWRVYDAGERWRGQAYHTARGWVVDTSMSTRPFTAPELRAIAVELDRLEGRG